MLGRFLRTARNAVVVSVFVFLIPPAGDATTHGSVTTQAQHYLSALFVAGSVAYDSGLAIVLEVVAGTRGQGQVVAQISESSILLLMGLVFLILARRVRDTKGRAAVTKAVASPEGEVAPTAV
jgi:hypothetical protein